jgi:threonine aldolase
MRRAMADAEVGDAQMGEDPSTLHLQERVAALFGKEAALFLPTGSMCNKVAIASLTRPGDAVVCDHLSHPYRFEGGGPSALWGIVFEPIVTPRGQFTPEQLAAVMNRGNVYQARTALVCLEQTHNFAGGTVWPIAQYEAVCATAREHGASIYTDGARVLNAVVASNVTADRWGAPVDAIWLDFSKGLGGPGGAAIAGSADFIAAATRFAYLLGGAMRQSGFLAAAALYGLDHNVGRLGDDHANAARLAAGLADLGLAVSPPESNMAFCASPGGTTPAEFVAVLAEAGVRASVVAGRIRMVTHLGITASDVESALQVVAGVLRDR